MNKSQSNAPIFSEKDLSKYLLNDFVDPELYLKDAHGNYVKDAHGKNVVRYYDMTHRTDIYTLGVGLSFVARMQVRFSCTKNCENFYI